MHVHFTQMSERFWSGSVLNRVFAKASLHLVSVVMAGHVQDGAATSRVRREISVFIATCRPLVEGGRGLGTRLVQVLQGIAGLEDHCSR